MTVADPRTAIAVGGAPTVATRERTRLQASLRFLRRYPRIVWFSLILALMLAVCMLAPLVAPYGPKQTNTRERLLGPSSQHFMGTDQLGRDTFTRVLYGGRVSIPFPMLALVLSAAIGITAGVLAGFYGGVIDMVTARIVDAQIAFPELVLLLLLANTFRPGLLGIMVILGITGYPGTYRLARGQVLQAREFDYVQAATTLGASPARVMFRHILPNILNPLIITLTLGAGSGVLLLASLSFLGLGPQSGTADWGLMFNDALNNFRLQPWLVLGPGLAVTITAFAFYMLGDALRDALDPRLRSGSA